MANAKAEARRFKKGDAVYYVGSWDRGGTFFIIPLTVYSCGAKQMVLVDAQGEKFAGCHFGPAVEQSYLSVRCADGSCADVAAPGGNAVLPAADFTYEMAAAEAARRAAHRVGYEIAYAERQIEQSLREKGGEDGYTRIRRADVAKLRAAQVRVIDRSAQYSYPNYPTVAA